MKQRKPIKWSKWLIELGIVVAVGIAGMVAGIFLQKRYPAFNAIPLYIIVSGALLLLCVANRIAARGFQRKHFGMPLEERQPFLDAHRRASREDPDKVLRERGNILVLPVMLVTLFYLLTVALIVVGAMCGTMTTVLGVLILMMPVSAQLTARSQKLDRSVLIPEDALPHLHELARRAASEAGVRGSIRIELPASAECEVSHIGHTYVVLIGSMALAVSTEEELYADMVRGFSLYADRRWERTMNRRMYFAALASEAVRQESFLFDLFYSYASVRLEWELMLAHYPIRYKCAALAAARAGDASSKRVTLNRLTKQEMWRLFNIEYAAFDPILLYETPEPPTDYEARLSGIYRRAIAERWRAWCHLLDGELATEGATALLLREERAILGMADEPFLREVQFPDDESAYGRECMKAIAMTDARIARELAPTYVADRIREYLEPLEVITEWEASDRQRMTTELSPVINAYRDLYRHREAEALCDDILEHETNQFAQAHALFVKGHLLLRRYETEGIDYIYRAMDINKNYMENGLSSVESYCALCGLADELAAHRRRAVTLREAHSYNQYDAGSLAPTDRLVREEALGDMLEDILGYMERVSDGCIERVYLVRKIVSEDFFTSAFVLYFTPGAPDEAMHRAYEAIFNYLDAYPVDWQFSLFVYDRTTEAAVRRVEGSLVWERKPEDDHPATQA